MKADQPDLLHSWAFVLRPIICFSMASLLLSCSRPDSPESAEANDGASTYSIEFADDNRKTLPACAHCGMGTERIWGYGKMDGVPWVVYYITWTDGVSEHAANVDLFIGSWGQESDASSRAQVSLLYRNDAETQGFMVVDAPASEIEAGPIAGAMLSREQVMANPSHQTIFDFLDYVWLNDERLPEIRTTPPTAED